MNIKGVLGSISPKLYLFARDRYHQYLINRHKSMSREELIADISAMYRKRIGRDLNLSDPRSYTEKIQWSKFYNNDPLRSTLSDKLLVREWIEERIGSDYLIPLLGVYSAVDEISYNNLPDSFVLKTNNASGTNIVVSDKSKINEKAIARLLRRWLAMPFGWVSYEPQYLSIDPCIIAEAFIQPSAGESDLRDYKFLCFDGIPAYVWVDVNRNTDHARAVFDTDWNLQSWSQFDYPMASEIERPGCLEEMISVASKLSQGFSHVRVDLYESEGKVYFGEMTFTNGGGFEKIVPREYDDVLGSRWTLEARGENDG